MKTFHSMNEALPALLKEPYYVPVMKEILFSLYSVEQLRAFGEEGSAVIILETEEDIRIAEKQYALSERIPETQTQIDTIDEIWFESVYVLDDAGNGIVCFQRVPRRNEK